MSSPTASTRTLVIALLANLGIAVSKFVAAAITGSSAMLTEGVHSVVDSVNQLLLMWGRHEAKRKPDEIHPFGYGRELYFWSFVVAVLVFSLGAGVSVYEGILHIAHPEPAVSRVVAYAVLLIAFVLEGWSTVEAYRDFKISKGKLGWFQAIRVSKDPPAFIVLLENGAAKVAGTDRSIAIAALAREAYTQTHRFKGEIEPGLTETGTYDPPGTFSNACHVAEVEVDIDTGRTTVTRYLVADACFFAKKPLVTAAIGRFDGTLTTIRAHERGADGEPNPTYRCLFPEPPPAGSIPACAEAGVLGALPGILGSMMALEVMREIVGFGEGLVGRLLMVDARDMRFETIAYGWNPDNPLTGRAPTMTALA